MSWAKFDDRYDENEKVEDAWDAAPAAIGLHAMAATHCSRQESDGVIAPRWLRRKIPGARERTKVLEVMVKVGLFDLLPAGQTQVMETDRGEQVTVGPFTEDRYVVHDYLQYNPSKVYSENEREWDRRRKELSRDVELIDAIRARDRDRCRYCAVKVNWRDRRGTTGGTYDHIQPRGANTLENVVVACRSCNSRKGQRTPAEAGMTLLAAGQIGSSPDLSGGQVGAESVQATRPDPSPPHPENTPLPPEGEWSGPPVKPTDGRKRGLDRYDEQVVAYAAWLLPEIEEPYRTQHVRSALSGSVPAPLTNERVAAWVRQWEPGVAA